MYNERKIMKIILLSIILVLSGCIIKHYPPEKAAIEFDNRKWVLANSDRQPGKSLYEYTPQGQNSQNWNESIGAVFLASNISNNPKNELSKLFTNIKQICSNASTSIVEEKELELVYHWYINNCENVPDQHEIGRFIKTKFGVHKISYVRKTTYLIASDKEYWVTKIKNAKIVENHEKTIGIPNNLNTGY